MRPNNPNKRLRGRNRNKSGGNPLARSYESNGPDVKIRGSALQVADKYAQLARDAQSSGDRVMAENYLQHAEHYYRIVAAAYEQNNQRPPHIRPEERRFDGEGRGDQPHINGYDGMDDDEDDGGLRRPIRAGYGDGDGDDDDDGFEPRNGAHQPPAHQARSENGGGHGRSENGGQPRGGNGPLPRSENGAPQRVENGHSNGAANGNLAEPHAQAHGDVDGVDVVGEDDDEGEAKPKRRRSSRSRSRRRGAAEGGEAGAAPVVATEPTEPTS